MKRIIFGLIVMVLILTACGAPQPPTGAQQEAAQQQTTLKTVVEAQPAPQIDWSLERHLMIALYQARNDSVATYSYVINEYTGKVIWSCASIGFPIPGGTRLTNPMQETNPKSTTSDVTLPAIEPNGIYPPDTSYGTFVMCVNKDGTISPVFEELSVTTFLYPMEEKDGMLVPVQGVEPSLKIDPKH